MAGGGPAGPAGARPAGRVRRWAPVTVLMTAVILGTAGCQSTAFTRLGLPVLTPAYWEADFDFSSLAPSS